LKNGKTLLQGTVTALSKRKSKGGASLFLFNFCGDMLSFYIRTEKRIPNNKRKESQNNSHKKRAKTIAHANTLLYLQNYLQENGLRPNLKRIGP
jgi:hypothetical protein